MIQGKGKDRERSYEKGVYPRCVNEGVLGQGAKMRGGSTFLCQRRALHVANSFNFFCHLFPLLEGNRGLVLFS